ncbi:alpha-1,4-glucan--maltose-1-phosphate maltosyltransferase [Pontibacter sp. BT310]|uniref:Alpha-1,4-glucan:maltose-1-phosphate maltosyltransferase n=1 Tax=Pontibacter populi TaxID=890055 RepID=A0ABS6XC38_9BACT|nr:MULTISPECIES: alpha-1,4-glucan--maltose-1-phosphate maltosyltransferase [Pontibacter]MBJ6118623.1 alpha-1,4-glucan--maltose-1-phosphate maltosyltransferase [Pontibacter sp. BT310]MBR0571052.1 alpha-1,4-glucan--maltose-1-phosphate maltosyltransferase [Microvirga sp. STS03]MBW3365477.1 alpha-1,4-glucan--maltose-1-phosphate maltosyltransferase [Pontibacter populi]
MEGLDGTHRVIIENVKPELNCGQYPVKRVVGEELTVTADIFGDGHDEVKAALIYRHGRKKKWSEVPMQFLGNDRWQASFTPDAMGIWDYTLLGWIDHFYTWQKGLRKKFEANQDIAVELQIGAQLMEEAAGTARAGQQKRLLKWAQQLRGNISAADGVELATSRDVTEQMNACCERKNVSAYHKILQVDVERQKALFSTWYEFFPRSAAQEENRHGTFQDCERLLPRIAEMGFDTIYLPPIHPIGRAFRKGKNNATTSEPGEPGSPWAIGAEEGGHKSILPELGTLDDFRHFVHEARNHGIEVALDFAIQCSPDHPYVKEHPQWFKWRPDGTVQYAENPPKKYQDVLPVNFETEDWQNLWQELKSIVLHWIEQGVYIFRVDNPHTKTFHFWEWMIREVRAQHPQVIFLAEAFTRPRVMERLGKIGFTQSYTYFTWRNNPQEIREYLTELTQTDMREYYRPNFWPNTPDILPEVLQHGGEPAHIMRVVLAATLSSNYGLYGPVYEFSMGTPYPGKEEYIDSEKYEVKHWDWGKKTKVSEVITLINKIRKVNPALQTTWNIAFGDTDNPQLLCFAKWDNTRKNKILVVANMDPYNTQSGWVQVPIRELQLPESEQYMVHDLLTEHKYTWQNEWNYVELRPHEMPVHVFRIEEANTGMGHNNLDDTWLPTDQSTHHE